MGKGGHSSSHSHSSTRSNSGGRSGHSHSSKGGTSEKTGERPTQTKSGSDANRRPLSKSPIRSDASILSKGRVRKETILDTEMMHPIWREVKKEELHQQQPALNLFSNYWISVLKINQKRELIHPIGRKAETVKVEETGEGTRDEETEVMNPTARKVEEEETERGESEEEEEEDQLQPEANLLSVHSTMVLIIIPQTKMMQPDVRRKVKAVKVEEVGEEEIDEECGGHCEMPELLSCSCHPGIYCEDCFRTLRRSFRDKFECSLSKRNVLMLPDDGKVYLLSPSGRSMFQKLYVQVKSPYDASTFCTAAKYPSERFNFSGRDEEISRKLLKKLHFKHHRTRKGRRNPKRGRGT
ncbi:hypothetical protein T12_111 [Trichinella patagoniensis]|uniref:Uncharacterized protein n=1 Tax=Trichinella patagoniensis TaxID=990121 RepID=A0A0V0ZA06_9BILA|nr:hypothetical protein T12_111 [Trichinella patagoniensis]